MILRAFVFFLCFLSTAFAMTSTAAEETTPLIRVRLARGLQSVLLKGVGVEVFVGGHRVKPLISSDVSEVQIELSQQKKSFWKVRWNGQPVAKKISGEDLEVRGLLLKMGNLNLPRSVHFHRHQASSLKFDLISKMNLENYLAGVLPNEMPPSWPREALKAQSIAARSFALVRMQERRGEPFDVEASVSDQAFEFSSDHVKKTKWNDKIQSVLQSTKGQVLFYEGKVVKAYYHSDCGGRTELASNVWGAVQGYNGAIVSCEHSQGNHQWSYRLKKQEFEALLRKYFRLSKENEYDGLRVASLSPSGRINHLVAQFGEASFKISAQHLRSLLGFGHLKSTFFSINEEGDFISFSGRGFGHGVGMCQYGARAMADSGSDDREILARYFPGTQIKRVNRILLTSAVTAE
jgi:stage II sporulation protein D